MGKGSRVAELEVAQIILGYLGVSVEELAYGGYKSALLPCSPLSFFLFFRLFITRITVILNNNYTPGITRKQLVLSTLGNYSPRTFFYSKAYLVSILSA